MRRSYLKQMIESSKARLNSIDAAGKEFKAFKKYDKAWRRSAD